MRLAEVRDLVAGQSWWDVGQHRLGGGDFAMHWSRVVDLPLAALMRAADPLVGPAASTRIAVVAVPLATLLTVLALTAALTRTVAGTEPARRAVVLALLSVPLVYQLMPLRIDHHGWQVALALGAALALVSRPTARAGAAAGACLAALLTVSLEGLPISAAVAGALLLGWALDPARRAQALAFVAAWPGTIVVLHLLTRGPGALAPACDAVAPVWIAAVAIGCGGAAATMLAGPRSLALRLAGLALAGIAALAAVRLGAPECTRGPFGSLDPLVTRFWYVNVSEGMPVWVQVPSVAAMTVGLPLAGLIGAALAWREAAGTARARWSLLLPVAGAALALTLLVTRAGATANALALPGAAWLLTRLLARARAVERVGPRTLATAAAFVAATPGLAAGVMLQGREARAAAVGAGPVAARPPCDPARDVPALGRLPTATLFAPLDLTPAILAATPHRAVASGYHRNGAAIHRVIATFLAAPDTAWRGVAASGARFVVGCPGANETELYKRWAPDGLWARLERGERVAWLAPVAIPGARVLVWRVLGPHRGAKQPLS